MDIGFFVGHRHFLPHAISLVESINKNIPSALITVVVTEEEYDFFCSAFEVYKLEIIKINKYSAYPFIDKIQAAAEFEKSCTHEYLWVDVDSYINKKLLFDMGSSIQINTVDIRNIGIAYKEKLSNLWKRITDHFHIDYTTYDPTKTIISKETIYPYYNIGCVYVRENKNLFQFTFNNIKILLKDDRFLKAIESSILNKIFFHQAVFTAALRHLYDSEEIKSLPRGVNVPIHLYKKNNLKINFNHISSFRYDNYFDNELIDDNLPETLKKKTKLLTMLWYY